MPDSYSIDEPNTLFNLPQPIDPTSGQTWSGPVFSLTGSRKRKRSEIVVGVDGECLNVFNIKTPRLLVTHALPPQTYLTAPPVSARIHSSSAKSPPQLFTYAATRNQLAGTQHQLLCFQESLGTSQSQSAVRHVKDVAPDFAQVVHIEPVSLSPDPEQDAYRVLVVHKDGEIAVLSSDLKSETGRGKLKPLLGNQSDLHLVELVSLCSPPDAARTLLVNRPDLASQLDPSAAVLLIVTSSNDPKIRTNYCHVLSIRPSLFGSTSQTTVETLLSCPLGSGDTAPLTSGPPASQLAYHDESATLYKLQQERVAVFDVKQSTPSLVSEFRVATRAPCQLLPLSDSLLLVFSQNRCVLYNSKYGAVQATQQISESVSATSPGRKRKRADDEPQAESAVPLSFHPRQNLALCLLGSALTSLGVSIKSTDMGRANENRLIDSIGRSQSSALITEKNDIVERYEEFSKSVASQDPAIAEESFSKFANSMELHEKQILALWLISTTFSWNQSETLNLTTSTSKVSSIQIISALPLGFDWVMEAGLLTTQNIAKSLLTLHGPNEGLNSTVSDSDMVLAIAQEDLSLSLLARVLASLKLGSSGYVESFRVLMESFNPQRPLDPTKLIQNATKKELANGIEEHQLKIEEDAALEELELATSLLESEFDARGIALKICIERLGTNFSSSELVQALRNHLSHKEIFMLVEILRIELDQAGWTSRRLDFHPSHDTTENQNEAITVICKLLNCALDAIGTVGWLSRATSDDADDVDSMISLLRTDTSAVLEGVQESTFFSSFLKDFIRFEEALKRSSRRTQEPWPANEPSQLGKSMLPLGLREAHSVASTRVKAGGEIHKRSARERALEISQRIGKYTFETIRI